MSDSRMNIRLMSAVLILLLILIFTLQNATVISINFLFWKFSVSRAMMIFFVFVAGVLTGWILSVWRRHHRQT